MAGPLIVPVVDEGLGNSAYLADLGDGRALAIDVPRDLREVRAAADRIGLAVAFAADTHLHADFLSGALQLAAEDGAHILASAAGGRAFGHRGLADGDEVDLGGLTLRAWATPGHTAEHLAYLLLDGTQVLGVFTGGSLLVGAAARTDLAGPEHTESLARSQYASLHSLLTLPDATLVKPRPARSAPQPSGGRGRPTRCWPSRIRTRSSRRCWPAWAPSLAISCGCLRRTGAALPSWRPPLRSPR